MHVSAVKCCHSTFGMVLILPVFVESESLLGGTGLRVGGHCINTKAPRWSRRAPITGQRFGCRIVIIWRMFLRNCDNQRRGSPGPEWKISLPYKSGWCR
jgi:hypothetical protein